MENVSVFVRKNLTMDKYFSQVKIVTPNNISKLLKTSARAVVSSVEVVNNFLLVSGKIVANAVYINDDNSVENTETAVDFVEKQKINFVLSELVAEDELEIQNVNFSTSEVVLSLAHTTKVTGIYKYLLGDATKIEDNLVLNKKELNVVSFKQSNDDTFVVAEEIETNLKNIQILNAESSAVLTSVVCAVDKVILEGKVKVNAIYSDVNSIGEMSKEFEFKQEIAVKSTLPGMTAELVLRHLNTSIVEQSKEEKNTIAFVIDLSAKAYVYENTTIQTYDDIFSLTNEIVPVYELMEFEEEDGFEFDTDTVLTQTNISQLPDFDDLIGVYQPTLKVVEVEDKGDKLLVVSEISALALYKTQTSAEKLELNYETRFETAKDLGKKPSGVEALVAVSAYKVKAGKDLESAFSVEYKFNYEKQTSEKFVKSFDLAQEKEKHDAGVKVYVARANQSVFDVAKTLNVRPELIKSQMEVNDYFEAGQKVYVYCPLNIV